MTHTTYDETHTPGWYALPCKILAVTLSLITVLATLVTGIGIGLSAVYDIYQGVSDQELLQSVTQNHLYDIGYMIGNRVMDMDRDDVQSYLDSYPGLYYDITLEDGTVLFNNYDGSGADTVASIVLDYQFDYNGPVHGLLATSSDQDATATASGDTNPAPETELADPGLSGDEISSETDRVKTDLTTAEEAVPVVTENIGADIDSAIAEEVDTDIGTAIDTTIAEDADAESAAESATYSTVSWLIRIRLWGNQDVLTGFHLTLYRMLAFLNHYPITVMVVCLLSLLVSALLFLYLLYASGHHQGEKTVRESPPDRIPFDLFTVGFLLLAGAIITAALFVLVDLESYEAVHLFVFLFLLLYIPFYLLLVGYFMSLATRIKTGRLWKNTLIGILLSRVGRGLRNFIHTAPLVQKTVLWISILCWGNLILGLLLFSQSAGVLFWLLVMVECLVLGGIAIRYALSLRHLQDGAHRIASGELDHQIDTSHMPHDCLASAEDLNHIGIGLSKAVEERLKSERFKTELITNVSHDIKTPLTSIINYVDLIKKMEPENPDLRTYVEVLDRQSNRLKKLIEDLMEASKASSGVLPVTLTPCALGVLLEQVEGEYAEKLAAKDLSLVVSKPDDAPTILADQRHLGRIFDNLMSNMLKYAQPGTRVYLDAAADGQGQAVITFRNISSAPLHIPAEELMERFVRGDASRHTEGSGLGLSIVQSLTELQGGHMHLSIDGDLFKVRLSFPVAVAPAPAQPDKE